MIKQEKKQNILINYLIVLILKAIVFVQHIKPTKALFFVPKIKTYMPLKTINRSKLEKLTASMKSKKSVAFILCRL